MFTTFAELVLVVMFTFVPPNVVLPVPDEVPIVVKVYDRPF
jgi:uncharacterized protein YhhL (DUF1145 family)